jgi:hypothetical protein
MDRATRPLNEDRPGEVVPLGVEPPEPPPGRPPGSSTLHSVAVLVSGIAATVAILSALAFVTVTWSSTSRRVVIAVMFCSISLFLAAVSTTILSAARDTYARRPR